MWFFKARGYHKIEIGETFTNIFIFDIWYKCDIIVVYRKNTVDFLQNTSGKEF